MRHALIPSILLTTLATTLPRASLAIAGTAAVAQAEPPLLAVVKATLDAQGWKATRLASGTAYRLQLGARNGSFLVVARTLEEPRWFVSHCILPYNVPEPRRLAVAEYLTRANQGQPIGNFEMDFEDGEIRFKTSIELNGSSLTPRMVERLIVVGVVMMDHYLPGLNEVIYAGVSPEAAIEKLGD